MHVCTESKYGNSFLFVFVQMFCDTFNMSAHANRVFKIVCEDFVLRCDIMALTLTKRTSHGS